MGMRPRAARSQAREVWMRKKENNIFDTTASRGTFFFTTMFGGREHELLQFSLLWLIGYIYITISKDLFMHRVFLVSSVCEIRRRKPGLVNGCTYLGEKWEADCISIHMYYLRRFEVFCIRATQLLRNAFSVHLGMHFRKFSENKHLHGLKN